MGYRVPATEATPPMLVKRWYARPLCWIIGHRWHVLAINTGKNAGLAHLHPVVARNVHDSVSYLKAYLTGDMAALPETRESTDDDRNESVAGDRQVAVRTARNGFIVEPAHYDGNGWMKALGDEVVFTDLTEMLRFCMDHLEGVPGTNWWEVSPWKEGRSQ